jgi:polyphosphate kinase
LNLAIVLSDPEDPEQENAATRLAIVSLPIKMQRWVSLSENRFVPLEHVVIYNLDRLFGGMEIQAVHVFRATRNADVERNEEEVCVLWARQFLQHPRCLRESTEAGKKLRETNHAETSRTQCLACLGRRRVRISIAGRAHRAGSKLSVCFY